ncbi:hypothetical protein [Tautonia sociabilis]|uniref:Uncharacterized protein n=1 Tax=Tautonia sociabilis TaxID=2080755 RepID=A0A432MHL1_9BACT|nr:hypothetical protein [Tautonia sociabilis]RUL86840.1 hypothetical protein TsocGM_15225 [Tautonia sociabilis]
MDAKEILRLMIRNRFWIVLGIAFLLPIIGYFVTAGTVKSETEAKASEIKSAKEGAQAYTSGAVINGQYAEFTKEKIELIEEDVREAHRRLYERQAPLLDWPEEVAPELTAWGRDIPEDIPPNVLDGVSYVYTKVYDKYAEEVYKTVDPWDPVTGEGIVVTPPLETLLATVTFDVNNLPSITKIWQYQENLWVRRSILEVIAQVNRKAGATDWESAPIKQINRLEVGNSTAVDHRTAAEGYELKDPPEVTKGGQSLEPEKPATASSGMPGMAGGMAGMEAMMESMMGRGEYGPGSGMMGGMATKSGEPVKFLQPEGVEDLFRDYPAYVSVLIDQNSIQNFLVEFENSPMSMRVLEANWTRPKTRVQPPVKGQGFAGFGMGGFGLGQGGGLYGMMGMEGMMPGMMGGMPGMEMMGGYGRGMGMEGMMGMGMEGMMPGMMGGYGRSGMGRSSLNQPRSKVRRDLTKQEKDAGAEAEPEKITIYDPYYNIVELQVYVQARFYYPPAPEETPEEGSPGDVATDPLSAEESTEPIVGDDTSIEPAPAAEEEVPAATDPADGPDATPVDLAPQDAPAGTDASSPADVEAAEPPAEPVEPDTQP